MEFIFRCKLCDVSEAWTTEEAAQSASVWHVWAAHPTVWRELKGAIAPLDIPPLLLGRRFEDWERQS